MAYAQTTDVETELGRPASSAAETDQWQAWLDRVERSIERAFRSAGLVFEDEIVGDDGLTVANVVDVEVSAVLRKIQNPSWGVTSTTRSIDDASITTRREGVGGEDDPLALTPGEWRILLPDSDAGAFSTRPGFEADTATEVWA